MNDWNSLDGNPAPGDPSRILNPGAKECARIAGEARRAFEALEKVKYEFSSSIWVGDTAIEFSKLLPTVIDDLYELNRGYDQVATALRDYSKQLSYLQSEALSTLRKADIAQNNIRSNKVDKGKAEEFQGQSTSNRDRAASHEKACDSKVEYLTKQHLNLQIQRSKATDPAQIASIDQSISNTYEQLKVAQNHKRDAVNSLLNTEITLDEANSRVKLASSRLSDAKDQYQATRNQANLIRDDHGTNAKRAAAAIREAKGTAVGTDWERFKHNVTNSETFQNILSVVESTSDLLGTISLVCNFLALFPGLNVVFGPVAAALAIVTTALAITQFLMKEFEGKSSGWERLANFSGVVLGVMGLRGSKGAVETLKKGWQTAGKLGLKSAWISGQANAVFGKAALQQANRSFKMLVKGSLLTTGTNSLKMTTFHKTVGGKLVEGSLDSISGRDIAKAVVRGKVTPRNVVEAYFGKKTVKIAESVKRYSGKFKEFFADKSESQTSASDADRNRAARNVYKILTTAK
jgi:hypothetical protein